MSVLHQKATWCSLLTVIGSSGHPLSPVVEPWEVCAWWEVCVRSGRCVWVVGGVCEWGDVWVVGVWKVGVASFPGCSLLQFLIGCSMQIQMGTSHVVSPGCQTAVPKEQFWSTITACSSGRTKRLPNLPLCICIQQAIKTGCGNGLRTRLVGVSLDITSYRHFYRQYLQQVLITPADYKKYQSRPQVLVARFIKSQLGTWNIHGTQCCVCDILAWVVRSLQVNVEMVRNLSYYTVCASIHSEWWSISLCLSLEFYIMVCSTLMYTSKILLARVSWLATTCSSIQ